VRTPITPSKNLAHERGLPTSPAPLDMEAFHLLSRGGVKFDKQKYRDDVKLFNVSIVTSISQQSNCSCSQVEVKYLEQKHTFRAENEERPPTS
jgi:hypothetical protein